ncbi:Hypothetical predicted protein [Mytilus galloprovincialis]|uniref:C1q domain-containing protein n=1 Tax=Mytilus galloprovincialis TaxID=29158 RepID=A0A8B6HRV7_MYTGA|nr:Hypothetical predicted protein [Mytilus galloprovincialis]
MQGRSVMEANEANASLLKRRPNFRSVSFYHSGEGNIHGAGMFWFFSDTNAPPQTAIATLFILVRPMKMFMKTCLLFVVVSANLLGVLTGAVEDKRTCMSEDLLKLLMKTDRCCDGQPGKYVSADRPAFLAYAKTSPKLGSVILFEDVATNIGKHYSPSTGVFTVPQNGLYYFGCMIMSSAKHLVYYRWFKNDTFFSNGWVAKTDHANSQTQNIVLNMKKGERMYIKLVSGGAIHGGRHSYISGYLL